MSRLLHKIKYHVFDVMSPQYLVPADITVDIVIPVTKKDLKILPLALEGVKRNVAHNISAIYVVARHDDAVVDFCTRHQLNFVDESEVLGYTPSNIGLMAGMPPKDRSGWLFQQLLKLSGRVGTSPYFITIDADHVLIRPHTFVKDDGRLVFYRSKEHHQPYYDNIKRLVGLESGNGLSYIAHKMVFDRKILADLRADIERNNSGLPWDKAIVKSVDNKYISGFSEFELFGNFVPDSGQISMPFRNHHLSATDIADFDTLVRKYSRHYAALTFPDYL